MLLKTLQQAKSSSSKVSIENFMTEIRKLNSRKANQSPDIL